MSARQLLLGGTGEDWGAIFSPCERYRYRLWRRWDPRAETLLVCMLNPSTADGSKDDPTVGRCHARARRLGFGAVEVVNLYALRSTDPAGLLAVRDPVGPDNDQHISEAARTAGVVVVAWGDQSRRVRGFNLRCAEVLALIGRPVHCLGTTDRGYPRHPLYVPNDKELVVWSMGKAA